MQLYIANKNYSSWSLRAWLLLTQSGIEFEEIPLRLDFDEGSPFKTALARVAPTGTVPVLVDDGFAVWDSLAITEYVAEKFTGKRIWPTEARARARARSLCAEMHAGFQALRNHCVMNIEAELPEVGKRVLNDVPAVGRDLARIVQMWQQQLSESGGPFLFGDFCAADAYYAPVCARIATYALPVGAQAERYVRTLLALPAMQAWCTAARAEHDFIEADEPYRSRPR